MRFIVETVNDSCYTQVLETVINKSLLHSKEQKGGLTCLEIQGSPSDFLEIRDKVEKMNQVFGYTVGVVIEGI
jgi:hypothetical protein